MLLHVLTEPPPLESAATTHAATRQWQHAIIYRPVLERRLADIRRLRHVRGHEHKRAQVRRTGADPRSGIFRRPRHKHRYRAFDITLDQFSCIGQLHVTRRTLWDCALFGAHS